MALSEAQLFGYSANVQELCLRARKPLEAGHVDVDGTVKDLKDVQDRALEANAIQEEAKRKAKEATDAFVVPKLALTRKTSSVLDMAIEAVGKGTAAAENFRRLRSDIHRATTPAEIAAVSVEVPESVEKP